MYDVKGRSLRHQLARINVGGSISGAKARHVTVRSLDSVSFEAHEGDRVGLIGQNGAGKTTLLRTLARIYEPVSGTLRIEGQSAPLFDITLGMDMEANGYENIKLRGLFLGMSLSQIEERMDEIVAFCELGDFLSMPLRTYSSGMLVRLAFAVVTSFAPDILLLDEMIGAGDATFLQKAQARLQRFIASARIMFLASHSTAVIKDFCNKAILLHHGKLVAFGPVDDVLAAYAAQAAA